MNNREARFILKAYRPLGQDIHEPQFQQALEQVKKNPELARWFEESQAFDRKMSEAIQGIPIPSGLKADVMAGRHTIRLKRRFSRRTVLAMAASLLLLVTISGFWLGWPQGDTSVAFSNDMIEKLDSFDGLDLHSNDLVEVLDFLAGPNLPNGLELPGGVQAFKCVGCKVIKWGDATISLVCFTKNGKPIHLFVAAQKALNFESASPQHGRKSGWDTVTWTSDNFSYLAVGRDNRAELASLL